MVKIDNSLVMILVISLTGSQALASQEAQFHYINLPGQNGLGGESFGNTGIINTRNVSKYKTLEGSGIDFGQGNCIRDFQRQFDQDKAHIGKKKIFTATSQGTATITNWLAQKTHAEQEQVANGVVLESVLGSGNSAIMHTVEEMAWKPLAYLPFARFWMPVVAKFVFPTYNPLGKSALKSAKKISPNIPMVIMHHVDDPQLDVNDAREMYCQLRENGNDNAYLLECQNGIDRAHLNILDYDKENHEKIAGIQAIYKKHGLPHWQAVMRQDVKPEDFQPTVKEVRKKIEDSSWKKRYRHNAIDLAVVGCIAGLLWQNL